MESTEKWLPVVGYEGIYEVSDHGRVRSLDRIVDVRPGVTRRSDGRVLSARTELTGYSVVGLSKEGRYEKVRVHCIVLEAFVEARPDGMFGCHNNGDPSDNRVVNLRWGTPSSNSYDKRKHGTDHKVNRTHCPRGHDLVQPNIVDSAAREGHRSCKACSRERARAHPLGEPFNAANADWQFQRIMSGETGRIRLTACKRGHALTGKNVRIRNDGSRSCLSCEREHSLSYSQGRPFDRAKADARFAALAT